MRNIYLNNQNIKQKQYLYPKLFKFMSTLYVVRLLFLNLLQINSWSIRHTTGCFYGYWRASIPVTLSRQSRHLNTVASVRLKSGHVELECRVVHHVETHRVVE